MPPVAGHEVVCSRGPGTLQDSVIRLIARRGGPTPRADQRGGASKIPQQRINGVGINPQTSGV